MDVTELKQAQTTLQQKVDELERVNEIMVDRELKMIELKEEIRALKAQLGQIG